MAEPLPDLVAAGFYSDDGVDEMAVAFVEAGMASLPEAVRARMFETEAATLRRVLTSSVTTDLMDAFNDMQDRLES